MNLICKFWGLMFRSAQLQDIYVVLKKMVMPIFEDGF